MIFLVFSAVPRLPSKLKQQTSSSQKLLIQSNGALYLQRYRHPPPPKARARYIPETLRRLADYIPRREYLQKRTTGPELWSEVVNVSTEAFMTALLGRCHAPDALLEEF